MSSSRKRKKLKSDKGSNSLSILMGVGIALILSGLAIYFFTFLPVIREEAKYVISKKSNSTEIKPVNTDFAVVIPKISANSAVIANVDPFNSSTYQLALRHGIAHAAGTAFPGHVGNSFLFAHSSADWYIANRYNSVFYLLNKLEKGDKIEAYYKGKKYSYTVFEKKLAEPTDISYLSPHTKEGDSTLTLMTCWPPGTTIKRLIIIATLTPDE